MHKSKILLIWLVSFIGGVFYGSFWSINLIFIWLIFIFSGAIFIADYRNKKAIVFSLAGIFFLLGVGRVALDMDKIKKIQAPNNKITTTAFITSEPEKKEYYQNIVVQVDKKELFKKEAGELIANGNPEKFKILVRTELYKDFKYGDEITLACQPEIVKNFSDDFDYRMYLAKDKIYYTCPKATIEKTNNRKNNIYRFILEARSKLENNINKIIPEPQASLANGLLFGGGNRLSQEMQAVFSKTGMTHIVAVSGYNVTIIAEYLMIVGIALGLWRPKAFYFALGGIFLFVAMIGFPSSAVRAGVMGGLILWAMKNGRLASIDNAVVLAGALMLLINPLALRWDTGFQLSFLATVGLIKLAPLWDKYLIGKMRALGILEIMAMTISAQLFVLPILLYNFHNLSVISIIANVFILPIIPLTMLFVFLSATFSFIFYPLALTFGWLAYGLLKYEVETIIFLGSFNWASLKIENFNEMGVIIWYGMIFILVYLVNKKK